MRRDWVYMRVTCCGLHLLDGVRWSKQQDNSWKRVCVIWDDGKPAPRKAKRARRKR